MAHGQVDCFIGDCLECLVLYEYDPGEPEVQYPNDKAHPGSPESVNIYAVLVHTDDILTDLSEECIERLEAKCLENEHEEY